MTFLSSCFIYVLNWDILSVYARGLLAPRLFVQPDEIEKFVQAFVVNFGNNS